MIRLDKYIASALTLTRKEAHTVIKRGRVTVDGNQVRDIGFKLDETSSSVVCDGVALTFQEFRYFIMNKPAGYITSTEEEREPTVMDLLPEKLLKMNLFPVGRLDKDTEGLLLLTDNGVLAHRMLSPKHHVDKTYYLESDLSMTESDVDAFLKGVDIGEKNITLPARLVIDSEDAHRGHITLCEGKFHQIKRMLNAVGKNVTYLERVAFASLTLPSDLERGEVRELTPEEIDTLENFNKSE
ncbi:MAG: rRNA pseudouridine synthase [Clostridia bacterium]|nr:rRNA pseudouridine synthase [Clostridia bacterium]